MLIQRLSDCTKRSVVLMTSLLLAASSAFGQDRGGAPGRGGGGGGGRGRGGIRPMTISATSLQDGAMMPSRFAQSGAELSPNLAWSGGPDSAVSYVLIFHDISSPVGNTGVDDLLHWMVWNIPGKATQLAEGVRQGPQLDDGSRQISASGPYYRGPAAPPTGPAHHYVFELFALDTMIDVPAVGQAPAATRAAVVAAMAGHVRGKGTFVVKGPPGV